MNRLVLVLLCSLLPLPVFGQSVYVNEVMSSNASVDVDEFGEYPDWVELYNGGDETVSLGGWGLSDDRDDLYRWTFPDIGLAPGAFLRVYASGRDVSDVVVHQETAIDWGDTWHYFVGETEPPAQWNEPDFEAGDWPEGPSGFGYDDGDDSTDVGNGDPFTPNPISIYVRTTFDVDRVDDVLGMLLDVDYDDGFVAYLNGQEIARANIDGDPPAHDQFADEDREAQLYRGEAPARFEVDAFRSLLHEGTNVLAVQVHNYQLFSQDVSLIPFLTLQMAAVPADARGPSSHLDLPTPNLHTSFRVDADGETLYLTDPSGTVVDEVDVPAVQNDLSWGRQPDGAADWFLFWEPTPGASNTTEGATAFAEPPAVDRDAGFYGAPLTVALAAPDDGAVIRYTLDGSPPTDTSTRYEAPLQMDETTVVRAQAFAPGLLPSAPVAATYFVDEPHPLPVVSLSTAPANFFDFETGIYARGPDASGSFPYMGANFWQDWEQPVYLELFDEEGTRTLAGGAGVKIFGAWSRGYPQKSLAVFARGEYGMSAFEARLFPDLPYDSYQAFVLRNSGQDWTHTLFRDAFVQSLMEDTGIDLQAYRPALVYLNGQFWGVHNIREKLNEHYVAAHHDVDPDNIDLIERDEFIIHGDDVHYRRLMNYVRTHSLAQDAAYDSVRQLIEVDNFIDYTSLSLYTMNYDWPWNNLKAWRPRTPEGRWRWLSYDFDYAYNRGPTSEPTDDVFENIRSQDNATVTLFYALLDNRRYRHAFANRFADHMNTRFRPENVLARIDSFQERIRAAVPLHADRWRGSHSGPWWQGNALASVGEWEEHVQLLRDFAVERPPVMWRHLARELGLPRGTGSVTLDAEPRGTGRIQINTIRVDDFPWTGTYLPDVPIAVTAAPDPGYRFVGWSTDGTLEGNPATLSFEDGQTITARFEPTDAETSPVVINEINYHPADDFDPQDWIELYNATDSPLDLSGWMFQDGDDDHVFTLPEGTTLAAGGYLVIAEDLDSFVEFFPDVTDVVGGFDFGLSGDGELVRLSDAAGTLVDSLTYGVTAPWPSEPDGTGATLALGDPFADNADPASWAASEPYGTPAAQNDVLPSAVEQDDEGPDALALEAVYPNPFRDRASIVFTLPQATDVSLKVYDGLGREVAILVDQQMSPGRHEIVFDGADLASGPYYCRLRAGASTRTRTMMLVR